MTDKFLTCIRSLLTALTVTNIDISYIETTLDTLKKNIERKDYIKIVYGNKKMFENNNYFIVDLKGVENYWCLKSQLEYQFNVKKSITEEEYKQIEKLF